MAAAQLTAGPGGVMSLPPDHPIYLAFAAAGIPSNPDPAAVAARLQPVPAELWTVLQLAQPDATLALTGSPAAIDMLRAAVSTLRTAGVVSLLAVVNKSRQILLVVSVIGLPEAGLNLADRRATGFRWYVVPIGGNAGASVSAVGSRTTFVADGPGVYAIACVGYASRGKTSPYEVAVTLPDGELLDLEGYEFTMNALDEAHPMGVMFNTFGLRQRHVDLDGDGTADPLPPQLARTFRHFRFERDLGESPVNLDT